MPDNRPTVLQLIGSFAQGGSERQAVQLTRLLAESGRWRVLVACLDPRGVLRPEVEGLGLDLIPAFPLTSFYHPGTAIQWMRFARYLRRNNVRIVQTHDFYTNVFGIPGAALAGVPVRIAARRETVGLRTAAQLKVQRAVYRLSHAVVTNAQTVRKQLTSEGVPDRKVVTIYNGIDLGRMARTGSAGREEILAQLGVTSAADRRFVTIVANLRHEVKDHPTFLRAARVVHTAMPQAVFLVAGEGLLIDPMRSLAVELGIGGSVFFLGRCERVPDLLSVSDVCVLSSEGEGLPNSILEYMAASRPVVATDVGGTCEAVTDGETGFLVAPGDFEGMAARILYLLRHPEEAAGMGERGRREVEARFSCAAQLRNTLALYDALLARRHPSHRGSRRRESTEAVTRSRPRRVLLIGPSLDILGGQAVQAAHLLAHLQDDPGMEAGFLPVNPRLPGPLRLLQRVKYLRTVVTSLRYGAALLWNVPRYDVLHIFSASYWSFLLAPTPALLAGRFYRKKTILNYHSGEAEDHLTRWRSARAIIRLADTVVVPSGYLVDVFARFGIRARPIFNIVDMARFRFRERRPLRPVFFSNRNLEPMYNVACLLRAFALVQERFPDARLSLAGDGGQRAALERLAETLDLKNVRFLGRVPNDKMAALYDAADIYLNASDIDNMPLSIIEAFAAGTPVISTDAGGIPYIVTHGKTGLLVPRNDHEAMAAQALRLLDDASLAARIASEARTECRKYEWAAVRDEWLTLYRELAP